MLDKLSGRINVLKNTVGWSEEHAVQGGVWEGGEKQWEKLHQALPAAPKQPEMKFPSVGEDPPPISTRPQFLWKRRASLGGKMPSDEQYGEGLRIAAGAGDRCPQGPFLTWGEGEGLVQPRTFLGPWQHLERRRGDRTRCGQTQCQMLVVSFGNNIIVTPTKHLFRAPPWRKALCHLCYRGKVKQVW